MTRADWLGVIDQAAGMGVRTVQFIGGEPTLHSGLAELVRHVLSRALSVEVFTNLVRGQKEHWEAFSQPGVSMAASYYSDDAEEHASVTGRSTCARTKTNIAEAQRRGIPLRAGVIDIREGQRVQHARDELDTLGVPSVGGDRLRRSAGMQVAGAAGVNGRCPR